MNYSLETVNRYTTDPMVKVYSQFLLDNEGQKFTATFEKSDGTLRSMTFVPRNEYNYMLGKETTEAGRKIVQRKALNNIITVVEFVEDLDGQVQSIQPRSINLAKLVTLKVAA